MKILYVARKSVFLKGMLECVEHESNEVFVLDLKNRQYIDVNNGHVIQIFDSDMIIKSKVVNYIFRYVAAIHFLLKFRRDSWDICHILNLKRENFWMIPILKRRTGKIVVTIFGVTTYKNRMKRDLFKLVYRYVDIISTTTKKFRDEFKRYYPGIEPKKIAVICLPLPHIEQLEQVIANKSDRSGICRELGLSPNMINISCSSTIPENDQHEIIIDALKKIGHKDRVQLMFLLTYGGTQKRKDVLIDIIKRELAGFNVRIFDSYMSNEEIAKYRAVTDVYVNIRISDQLASAVIESLYAGAYLISGSWLNYTDLDDLGIVYEKIDNLDNLSQVIDQGVSNIDEFKSKHSANNSGLIYKAYIEAHKHDKWGDFYKSLVSTCN